MLEYARKGQRVVLCLDEAQAMPLATLEALRLLTNLETEKRKLLQVVLFGQPELDNKLAHRAIRQLRQRITFQHILREMTRDDLDAYLRHRLSVAGYAGQPLFEPSAVRLLYRASRGVPRLVNVLAHKAMFAAYGEGSRAIQKRHLRIAAADTPEARKRLLPWMRLLPRALRMVRR